MCHQAKMQMRKTKTAAWMHTVFTWEIINTCQTKYNTQVQSWQPKACSYATHKIKLQQIKPVIKNESVYFYNVCLAKAMMTLSRLLRNTQIQQPKDANVRGFMVVSPSSSLCSTHLFLRDHGSSVVSHAPVANMLLLISSKDKFHPVIGLREVLFQLHNLGPGLWASCLATSLKHDLIDSDSRVNRRLQINNTVFTRHIINSNCTYQWRTV